MPLMPFRLRSLAWLGGLAIAGCASGGGPRGTSATATPAPEAASDSAACVGSLACTTDEALLTTPQLRNAVHDLGRLGLVTEVRERGSGKVVLTMTDAALEPATALAFQLEQLYRAYRSAYDLGDSVMLELWQGGARVGQYTSQGLLLRLGP